MQVSHLLKCPSARSVAVLCLGLIAAVTPVVRAGDPPVIDDPVPLGPAPGNFPLHVEPRVPIGKVLVFPITAADPEGGPLTYTVFSNKANIMVRARTGYPKLTVQVTHAGDGTAEDPAFSGELEFALLREFAPLATSYISGFAQSHYYHNQIFHRIADLNPTEEPDGSYIIQGGDPLGTGNGGPGFAFDNEFSAALIFSGRGQLAMANAGFDSSLKASNGSQFFITVGQPRFLDFNHTIFGQVLRGWDVMESMASVKRTSQDKPTVDVKLTSATVEPNFSDAVLLIAATGPATATVTVQATDVEGKTTSKNFQVTAYVDTINDPPFIKPVAEQTVAKDKILSIPLQAVDLERDYMTFANSIVPFQINGFSNRSGNPALVVGSSGYVGPLTLGVSVERYDTTYRGTIDGAASADDSYSVPIGVGDRKIEAGSKNIFANPDEVLTDVIIASYQDPDPLARPADFVASVNWGDGTKESSTDGMFPAAIERSVSSPFPGAYVVKASHKYVHAGTYPITVELKGTKGAYALLHGTASVSESPLHVFGSNFVVRGLSLTNGVLATIVDESPAALANYTARVHWGDGSFSAGVVSRAKNGEVRILGSHQFSDAGLYPVTVEVTKNGESSPVLAGSRAEVRAPNFKPFLPPYSASHLVGQISGIAIPNTNPVQVRPIVETVAGKTFGALELIVLNSGDKPSKPGKVRFYLSEDKKVNLQDVTGPDPQNPNSTIVTNPKDIPLPIGKKNEVSISVLQPGSGVRYVFDKSKEGDFRLVFPTGEAGAGLNIIADLDYSDPLTDLLPVPHEVVVGPFDAFLVSPTALTVKEVGGTEVSKKFGVTLRKQPRADVLIPVTLDSTATAQVTVDKSSLTFTSQNWNLAQEVTVTAKDDATTDGDKTVTVTLGRATSTDIRFQNGDLADVRVTVLDKTVTP